jgi:acetyl/propionyl-CoA carboxylase alpha subunit
MINAKAIIERGLKTPPKRKRGINIPPFYDPLIAKVIVYSQNRENSLHDEKALQEFEIEGINNNSISPKFT